MPVSKPIETETEGAGLGLDLTESEMIGLLPDYFDRFFEFFGPAHQGSVVPVRIKELARLKIAALNGCDT